MKGRGGNDLACVVHDRERGSEREWRRRVGGLAGW